ncbi:MAG TPA: hypothetical protein VNJ03_17890 [Vicinamibacterales bacterium]|nr:hypothetical protein [Vicinamibacterales bacterium]
MRLTVVCAFLLCLVPRMGVLWLGPAPDLTHYWALSSAILEQGAFGDLDTKIEPLYPAFLAAARWVSSDHLEIVLLLQVIVASAAGVFIWLLGTRLSGDRAVGWWATLFYAVDPYLVRQSISTMEIAFLTALLMAAAWAHSQPGRRSAVATGLLFGLILLTRFSVLPAVLVGLVLLGRRSLRDATVAAACVMVVWAPWSVRSYLINESVMPSRAGENLFVSLSDQGEQIMPRGNPDVLVAFGLALADLELDGRQLTPVQYQAQADRIMMREALRFGRTHHGGQPGSSAAISPSCSARGWCRTSGSRVRRPRGCNTGASSSRAWCRGRARPRSFTRGGEDACCCSP